MANDTRVMTGKVRLSYVHLFKPYAAEKGQEEKYSCTILVPKTDVQTKPTIPIYDGDGIRPSDGQEFGEECKGHWVFTASAKIDYQPGIVDVRAQPILNQSEIYSGIYARVSVNFFPYAVSGKKGIGCGLGNVQKLMDGEPLSAVGIKAENEFDEVEIDPVTGEPIL